MFDNIFKKKIKQEKYFYYKFALDNAREFLKNFPEMALSGSLARILVGLEPERNVGDIDFCINQSDFNNYNYAKKMENLGWEASDKTKLAVPGNYSHYRSKKSIKMCLFVIPDAKQIIVNGIKTQNVADLIYWKERFRYFRSHDTILTDVPLYDIPF